MDLTATAVLAVAPWRTLAEVADLATYPHWLGIVQRVVPDGDGWAVDIGARLGPFKKAKRVRMVRTVHDEAHVRFDRAELDGTAHSPWVLSAEVQPAGAGTELTVRLHYGGSAWLPGLDLVLAQEVRRAGSRLEARLL